jgi:hypothetical protein
LVADNIKPLQLSANYANGRELFLSGDGPPLRVKDIKGQCASGRTIRG